MHRYFGSPGEFESRVEGNMELEALEDQLRESCDSYMQRFLSLLDGAVTYHEELCSYLNDLQVRFDSLSISYSYNSVFRTC